MNKLSKILGVVMAAALMISSSAQAASIGINFGGSYALLSSTDVAGVIPQDDWNSVSGFSGTFGTLVDDSGAATTASGSWSAPGEYRVGYASLDTGDKRMMNGYIESNHGGPATVTLTVPAAYLAYDVYAYVNAWGADFLGQGWIGTSTNWFICLCT